MAAWHGGCDLISPQLRTRESTTHHHPGEERDHGEEVEQKTRTVRRGGSV
jgi:hypothetical protein